VSHRVVRRLLRSRVARPLTRPASDLLDSRIRRVSGRQDRPLQKDVARLRADLDALSARLAAQEDAGKRFAELAQAMDDSAHVLERTARLAPALELLLGHRLPLMERAVDDVTLAALVDEVRTITAVDRADHHVAVGYATLVELEARGLGRIAGSTENVVGKLTTAPLLDPPGDDVLEIGTLFGLFAAGLHRQLSRRGRSPRLTIVDPLDGVQVQTDRSGNTDRTAVPVVEAVVSQNLRLAGVPDGDARIVRGFSGDERVREAVGDRQYGLVVVDGDHSARGVAADLEWVEEIAAHGAVVVVDDYGDPKWRGVQAGVDAHLSESTRLGVIGVVASSVYLRAD
jgi:hypothetical protein